MNKEAKRKVAIINDNQSKILPAAELIANNVDLLTEILLWLPAKSTIRFRSVSRHWLSLLSDSQFASSHSTRNPRPSISGLYFYNNQTLNYVSLHGRRPSFPSLSFLDGIRGKSKIWIAHSCNGLLLCYYCGYDRKQQYIVCNLTTKKYKLLPIANGLVIDCDAYLAFDPSKSPHYYNVCLVDSYQIDVYSSQSSCWKKVSLAQYCNGHRSVFWNGAIHCLTNGNFLKRFDVDAEEIIEMANPQSPKILSLHKIMHFGECGGGLILIQSRMRYPGGFRILELERDYSGWIVKCRVNLRPLISEFPGMKWGSNVYSNGFGVLFAMEGESERDFALVLAIPGRIVSYNLKYKTWDVLHDLASGPLHMYAYPIVETLFPV